MKKRTPFNIQERVENIITEVTQIDEEAGTITGVCLLRPESRNNRVYTEKAMNSVRRLAEGTKSFLDHAGPFSGGSSVKDLLGRFSNIKKHDGAIYADL